MASILCNVTRIKSARIALTGSAEFTDMLVSQLQKEDTRESEWLLHAFRNIMLGAKVGL